MDIHKWPRRRYSPAMRHWVFDLDGTLVDSFGAYFDAMEEIFAAHGATFGADQRLAAITEPLDGYFARRLGPANLPRAFELLQKRSVEDAARIRPFEGLPGMLERLRGQGARLAVWTNRDLESARLILRHSGLEPLLEDCVSGTCVVRRKPHPEGLLRLIDRFECRPQEVTMVGDHDHDVTAARQAGARAVRASWHSYWEEPACATADAQFRSTGEFAEWALGESPGRRVRGGRARAPRARRLQPHAPFAL